MKNQDFKIRVTPDQSAYVQQKIFENGGCWNGGSKLVDEQKYLFYESNKLYFTYQDSEFYIDELEEITFEQFCEMFD